MTGQSFAFGSFRLDPAGLLWRDGRLVPLGRRGLLLLETLLRRRGEVVSKADLMDAAWPHEAVEDSNLSVQMAKLRKTLGGGQIRTVERVGYQFVDVAETVPPSPARRGNLDSYLVECVMRKDEASRVAELVMAHRLTSIVGPGGVGKTTLGLAVAKDLVASFRDGVWILDLGPLANASTLEAFVIETLGIAFRKDIPQIDTIVGALQDKSTLLVLDNCEHLVDAIAALLRAILAGGPNVSVLATTQMPLGIAGEHLFKLAPFDIGGGSRDSTAARFLAHCYAAQGETLTNGEWDAVDSICRDLDGLALPLQLAASQAAIMGFAAVSHQIIRRPEVNEGGRGTLFGSMEWSYGLLTDEGRRVFRTLGVFHGGFSLAGAAEVGGLGADVVLKDLVRRSMVMRDNAGGGRYRLLEPFRVFALELLRAAGEEPEARVRHARFVATFFRRGLDLWNTTPDDDWVELHRPESANLRSALDWAEVNRDWTQFSALTAASYRYWFELGLPHEAYSRCETALALTAPEMDAETRAITMVGAAQFVGWQTPELARLLDLDWAIAQLADERLRNFQVDGLLLKAETLEVADKPDLARPLFVEADRLVATMPDSKLKARALVASGMSRWSRGDKDVGRAKIDASFAMHAAFRNTNGLAASAIYAAEAMHRDGDTDEAIAISKETLAYFREHAVDPARGMQISNLTSYLLAAGRLDEARYQLGGALLAAIEAQPLTILGLMQNAAEVAALEGDASRAALLLGFVDLGLEKYSSGRQITEQRQLDRIVATLDAHGMDAAQLTYLRGQGGAMSEFEAQRLAGFAVRQASTVTASVRPLLPSQ